MKHYYFTSVTRALTLINDAFDELENSSSVLSEFELKEVLHLLNKVRQIL